MRNQLIFNDYFFLSVGPGPCCNDSRAENDSLYLPKIEAYA